MGIKLYHKGKADIHGETHVEKDENGAYLKDEKGNELRGKPFVFKPGTSIEFDDKTGAKLKRLYPTTLVSMDDVQRQFDGSTMPGDNAPVKKNIDGSDVADPAALAAAEAARLKEIDTQVAKRTYDALIAAGLTEEEAKAAAYPAGTEDEEPADAQKDKGGLLDRLKGKKA